MNDIDLVMSKLPKEITERDLDLIISTCRKHRANLEAGVKPKRERGPPPDGGSILDRILKTQGAKPAAKPVVRRRI